MPYPPRIFALTLIILKPTPPRKHPAVAADSCYSHDSSVFAATATQFSSWMNYLDSSLLLSQLSLPGTHDTLSTGAGGDITQTQSMDLATQLASGVRAFDLRLRYESDGFYMYHGIQCEPLMCSHQIFFA